VGASKVAEAGHEESYRALRESAGYLVLDRDVVRVAGPDAESYLQGQTSQDIVALRSGDCAWALVLQPQGKLDAFVRVHRAGPEEFFLVTDAGVGGPLVARLDRFKLRTKADVEQLGWGVVAVRGPAAGELGRAPSPPRLEGLVVPFEWAGMVGYDVVGLRPVAPEGVREVARSAYEAVRTEHGFPMHGAELDERTIPAEAGLVAACVSFTKGCYTGQELVARIDSRGSNVARHLRGLLLSGPARAGAPLTEGGAGPREVGRLTSVAFSPRLGWVALGYVGRAVSLGSRLVVAASTGAPGGEPGAGGEPAVEALVASLPLQG
jgi:folate-binding protein YgfZ